MIARRHLLVLSLAGGAVALAALSVPRAKPARRSQTRAPRSSAMEIGSTRTTATPKIDIRKLMPELAARAKITVRLHPRRLAQGEALPLGASKMGGDFLWPEAEPWVVCPVHDLPWVGVLQLRKADFPEVEFKPGADLLQVLWCPQRGHGNYPNPEPVLVWRTEASIDRPRKDFPRPRLPSPSEEDEERRQGALEHDLHWLTLFETNPDYMKMIARQNRRMLSPSSETRIPQWFLDLPAQTDAQFAAMRQAALRVKNDLKRHHRIPKYAEEHFLPRPCRLFPERVTEYPRELPDDAMERIATAIAQAQGEAGDAQDRDQASELYWSQLSVADGTKLQGYVDWSQSPEEPRCGRGHLMEHLLTIASEEPVGANWRRWRPVEEHDLYEQLLTAGDHAAAEALHRPAGLMLGDVASKYVFICRRCPEYPVKSIIQD